MVPPSSGRSRRLPLSLCASSWCMCGVLVSRIGDGLTGLGGGAGVGGHSGVVGVRWGLRFNLNRRGKRRYLNVLGSLSPGRCGGCDWLGGSFSGCVVRVIVYRSI